MHRLERSSRPSPNLGPEHRYRAPNCSRRLGAPRPDGAHGSGEARSTPVRVQPSRTHSRRLALVLGVTLTLVFLSGCYHARLVPPQTPPATALESETVWPLWWGLSQPEIAADNCMGNGVSEAIVTTNFGFAVITVVTLGITSPVRVQWQCAKDQSGSGDNVGDEL